MPTPRKLRLDSDRMARPTRWPRAAHTGATTLGSTLRVKMVPVLAPRARTARMYSFSRTESTLPYTNRAMPGQPSRPMTSTRLSTDAPTRVTRHKMSTMLGKDWNTSARRMIQNSHFPRR